MTSARIIEYRITRNLMEPGVQIESHRQYGLAERLIAILATAAALLAFGSYLPELVAASVVGGAVWVLGTR